MSRMRGESMFDLWRYRRSVQLAQYPGTPIYPQDAPLHDAIDRYIRGGQLLHPPPPGHFEHDA